MGIFEFWENGISGELPSELGMLVEVSKLDGHGNLLTRIPSQFGSLSKLMTLTLHTNTLEGGLPTEIGLISRLEHLSSKVPQS